MSKEPVSQIYWDGRHYDRLFGITDDLDFWVAMAARYGGPILELACGTGRVTLALAQAGYQVSGLDNSPAMLQEAGRKAQERGLEVHWIPGDMTAFDLDGRFPLIILPANALGHLLDRQSLERCLDAVGRHLDGNGRFIIDMFVPNPELLINRPGERYPFGAYDDPDGRGRIVISESYTYEADTQIKRIKTFRAVPGVDGEVQGELNLRMYFPQELDALVNYNRFVIEHKYGNHDQSPFDAGSGKQILVCRLAWNWPTGRKTPDFEEVGESGNVGTMVSSGRKEA